MLGGWEIVLILAMVLILAGAKKLPRIGRGLGLGLNDFLNRAGEVRAAIDQEAQDAGKALGGIYGKAAAQALTPDNQVAELYDPTLWQGRQGTRSKPSWFLKWKRALSRMADFLRRKIGRPAAR
jgi:Sec-independent protein translocase protein TatA